MGRFDNEYLLNSSTLMFWGNTVVLGRMSPQRRVLLPNSSEWWPHSPIHPPQNYRIPSVLLKFSVVLNIFGIHFLILIIKHFQYYRKFSVFLLNIFSIFPEYLNPKGGGGGGPKRTLWVFNWLSFLTRSCYDHKNSWLYQ